MINHNEKEYFEKMYIAKSLCCPTEINTTLDINYTSIKNMKN